MLLVPVVSSLFTPNLFVWLCVLKCKNDLFEKNNYLFFLNCSCILYVSHVYFPHMFEKASFTESLYISWELVIKAICFRTRLALDTLLYTIYWSFSVFFFCLYLFWYIYVTTLAMIHSDLDIFISSLLTAHLIVFGRSCIENIYLRKKYSPPKKT